MGGRLRLLFVIAQFDTGGVQHQVWLRLRHLDPARYECYVAVLTGGNSHLLDRVRALGVQVDFLRVDEERSLWGRVARIRDHIGRVQPDVVDTLLGWDNTYGAMAAVLAQVPLVVSELQTMGVMRTGYSRAFLALEAVSHRFFNDHVVCCSGAVREKYTRALPGFAARSSVIFDAVDTEYVHPDRDDARRQFGLPADRVIIGTLGRLHEVKDHDTLLRATRRLVDRRPDVLVVIGGAGALRETLLAQRDRLGLGEHVRFQGEVTEVNAFHAAIDVFVLTSRTEGFPVVLLEALAAGRPVVSTRVGGVPEMIEHGTSGLICDPGDDAALADAMATLADDASVRHRMAAAGRVAVERYGIHRLIEDWHRVYAMRPAVVRDAAERRGTPLGGPQAREASGVAWPHDASRVLVFRLCPWDRFREIVGALRQRYPDVEIDVVCQAGAEERLIAEGLRPLPYGDGQFAMARLGVRQLAHVRRRRYDLVVVPFNQPSREGYASAERCAAWAGHGRALGVDAWHAQPRPSVWLTWGTAVATVVSRGPRALVDALRSTGVLLRCLWRASRRRNATPAAADATAGRVARAS